MTILWAAVFMSGLIFTTSQHIYLNEKNNCNGNEGNIESLLLELKKIQQEVQQQRLEINEIRNLQTNVTLLRNLQQEVDELRRGYKEMKDLLTNLTSTSSKLNTDCTDLYVNLHTQSGVYKINPFGNERQITVYCVMETEGGGWTAIQKRTSGSVSFDRTWTEYRDGFGNPNDSYWIGNDVIHHLTKGRNSTLYVSITLQNGTTLYELYQRFSVSDESDNYRLYLGGPATGTLGKYNKYNVDLRRP